MCKLNLTEKTLTFDTLLIQDAHEHSCNAEQQYFLAASRIDSSMNISYLDETNFESTIRDYEFTKRAKHQIQRIVDSDDFQDMDSEAIFRYLYGSMQIVSFKDYLRRYIYEKLGIDEPFSAVRDEDYREIIAYSFDENAAPHSFEPNTTRFSMTIKGWLSHESVRRDSVFLLGFGLRMTDDDVSMFLTKVLKDEDFNFSDPRETAFWYCYHTQSSYSEAVALMKDAKRAESDINAAPVSVKSIADALNACLNERRYMLQYLTLLIHSDAVYTREKLAYMHFMQLVEDAKKEVAAMYNSDWFDSGTERCFAASDISSSDLEKVICSGIPLTKSGNLQRHLHLCSTSNSAVSVSAGRESIILQNAFRQSTATTLPGVRLHMPYRNTAR